MREGGSWRRLVQVFRRDPRDEIDDELSFHLEQRIRDYVARGMDPDAARRAALERLGDLERARLECATLLSAERRAHERRVRLSISWLDVKLGVRMLTKYPGLSLVSVIGMGVAIAIGAFFFGGVGARLDPTLPFPGGDRIVAVQNNRADEPGNPERQVLHDVVEWRSELTTVRDLGAYRRTSRNLIIEGRGTDLVEIAEMSAAVFRVARIPPLLGRPLLEDDERAGAPVLVIGQDEWQRRFDADPQIIGRTVRLGETVHTVVGVMRDGFRFPVNHGYWVPLRLDVLKYERGAGPSLLVVGRLADGVTIDQARAQISAIGRRMAAAYPDTHQHLRPTIVPYANTLSGVDSPGIAWALYMVQVGTSLLLVLVAANVAVLVYARTATRTGEIAVRTALGASRARVVTQLFVEALVLSAAAAASGLTLAGFALGRLEQLMELADDGGLPFWFDLGVSGGLIAYVAALAILGGTIVGVLPALKATGRNAYGGLQQLAARGSQIQLGRTWTALIVVQVGVAVAVLPTAIYFASELFQYGMRDSGYPAEEFFSAELELEREAPPSGQADAYERAFETRFAERADALLRRLAAEPGVGVSFASELPGGGPDRWFEIEDGVATVEAAPTTRETTVRAAFTSVGAGFFELYDFPILAGRGFVDADAAEGSRAAIIDRTFAERMGGGSVVGRRIRDGDTESAPWLDIVGVVDLPRPSGLDDIAQLPRVYLAATPGGIRALGGNQATSIRVIVRTRGGPTPMFTRRLRDLVASVDPGFQLHGLVENRAEDERAERRTSRTIAASIAVAMVSVLLLSAAGIYAMLSFTVARRRREIGIRIALGADRRRILRGIFGRAGAQLGMGVAVGVMLALALQWATDGGAMGGGGMGNRSAADGLHDALVLMPVVAAIVMAVGLLAALGPARRGLAVQPTEALREE